MHIRLDFRRPSPLIMEVMNKSSKILITGLPGSGKTTVIRKIASQLKKPYNGFFTNEIRRSGNRVGFEVESFSGRKGMLAHVDSNSPYRVGKYGVNLDDFEKTALPEMENAIEKNSVLIIDEIGKMELFSDRFSNLLLTVFNSELSIIATILMKSHPFCDRLRVWPGAQLLALNNRNREKMAERAIGLLS